MITDEDKERNRLRLKFRELGKRLEGLPGIDGYSETEIQFSDGATNAERAAARAVFDAFDFNAEFQTVEDARTARKDVIDQEAEQIRQRFITSTGVGQAMVYQEKYQEALRLQTDATPDPSNYPLLSAEISIRGATIQDVATVVIQRANGWRQVAGSIERLRQSLKVQIDAAATVADVDAVFNGRDWSSIPTP